MFLEIAAPKHYSFVFNCKRMRVGGRGMSSGIEGG